MAESLESRRAWEPYRPSADNPWDLKKVGHLQRRASFGATWADLQAGLKDGPDKTIDHLFQGGPESQEFKKLSDLAESIKRVNSGQQTRAWWLLRMLESPHPLREKLTLFWHNHFATSNSKVNNVGYMLGQYELMYRHALGNFRTLLQEMSRDPAMMVWLDTSQSKKAMPNENYARELMELFSLGIGHYTEKDIREAARAFTGWEIKDGKGVFNPKEHDPTEKTFLGKTGKFRGEDVVAICLEQKSAPYFICGKLYRFLVSETNPPTPDLLEPLADQFRKSDYDFGALVKTVLRSNHFFSASAYRSRIKAPVDYALGIVRGLEGKTSMINLATTLEELGQNVFYPPSVKGWDGGPTWLNGQTLLTRQNLTLALTSTEDGRFGRRTDPAALARKHGKSGPELVEFFLKLFLQDDVPAESRRRLEDYQKHAEKKPYPVYWTKQDAEEQGVRSLCRLVLALPEFQLD